MGGGHVAPGERGTRDSGAPGVDDGQRSQEWYAVVAVALPTAALLLCAVAARLGTSRADNALHYFYEAADVGHPGIVNVVTSMAFCAVAAIALLLGLLVAVETSLRLAFVGATLLFAVLALDNLLRLHEQFPGGDDVVHLAYWLGLAAVAWALWRVLHRQRGSGMLIAGLALLATSEAIDLFTRSDDPNYRHHERLALVEESTACVGAWCCLVGVLGLASVLVTYTGRQRSA